MKIKKIFVGTSQPSSHPDKHLTEFLKNKNNII